MRSLLKACAVFIAIPTIIDCTTAATIHIPSDYSTIQAGIDASVDGDTVLIAEGTYFENSIDFLGKAILVTGADPEDSLVVENTVVDGDALDSVFYFHSEEDSTSILQGLTIRNGWSADFGGGIYSIHSSPAVRNCYIRGNTAFTKGGGIYCYDSDLILENCLILLNYTQEDGGGLACYGSSPSIKACRLEYNSAFDDGGGIFCRDESAPIVINTSISENSANGDGAGVCCLSSSPHFQICTVTGNSNAKYGGGIYCNNSQPSFLDCNISANEAIYSGGGCFNLESNVLITEGIISDNTSRKGGGILLASSSGAITKTLISGNHATSTDGGGGIRCNNSSPEILSCMIEMNTARDDGGGILCDLCSSPQISNCIITGNTTRGYGAGISCWNGSSPTITFCTFTRNTADVKGGGLSCTSSSSPILTNCILWNDSPSEIYNYASSPVITYSDIEGGWGGEGNIRKDPQFYFPENDDFHLEIDSPCIDSGKDCCIYEDKDGILRPQNADFDIGAYEFRFEGPVLYVSPCSFLAISEFGGDIEDDILTITSAGTDAIEYSVNPGDEPWLSLEGDLVGVMQPGESVSLILHFDISTLDAGVYLDTISVTSNDPWVPSISVPVRLEIMYDGIIRVPGNCSTIQTAINIALEGAVVLVADGTYTGNGNKDLDYIGKSISIISENGAASTVIDCENEGRGFYFHCDEKINSKLIGFQIMNGFCIGDGGGISCVGASPYITDCNIMENYSPDNGGGIACDDFSCPTINNCLITNNSAFINGGGISCSNHSSPTINSCLITGNSVIHQWDEGGGGVFASSTSAPLIGNCTISGNQSSSNGGGIYCSSFNTITNCSIMYNSTRYRGGGICYYRSPTIINCVIIGNSSSWCGGGIGADYGAHSPTIKNCTIYGNVAEGWGGGIDCNDSNPIIRNCIFWNDSPEEIYRDTGNPAISYSDIEGGWAGGGNIDADPRFVSFGGFDYLLHPQSPCIDAGDPGIEDALYDWHPLCPDWYVDGVRSDMGAYGGPGNIDWFR